MTFEEEMEKLDTLARVGWFYMWKVLLCLSVIVCLCMSWSIRSAY